LGPKRGWGQTGEEKGGEEEKRFNGKKMGPNGELKMAIKVRAAQGVRGVFIIHQSEGGDTQVDEDIKQ